MSVDNKKPIFPISVAAKLLDVHPRTLRIYEEEGLLKPARQGNKRFFSNDDIEWVRCLRKLIHEEGISIPGIKKLLELTPCWQIMHCPGDVRENCTAFVDRSTPCWQQAKLVCAREPGQCECCEVFVKAMARAEKTINAAGL
ncbi:MAG: MerR family transcriptional regulator [Desulfurivibrionaceae bacterium]|nr:MerR family transcriptional regulator [Desulfobulbales bacterium]MDT8335042.1 MerR family transcriptional regulator [Desulfurivibrionaceae bacterium]